MQTLRNDFLTTVSNAERAGQPVNVCVISPGCHIDEKVQRVPEGESKREPFCANICMGGRKRCSVFAQQGAPRRRHLRSRKNVLTFSVGETSDARFPNDYPCHVLVKDKITEQHILLKKLKTQKIFFWVWLL